MSEEIIDLMVEGGKAVASPAMAQQLGPMKINISDVIGNINDKTKDFSGMKVPVKVIVDTDTKDVNLTIGTPPTSELIKKELKIDKASDQPDKSKVGNLGIEQIIKISNMKKDSMITSNLRATAQSVIGTCNSLGVLVEGINGKDIEIDEFKKELEEGKTEIDSDKANKLKKQLKAVQAELDLKFAKMKQAAEEAAAEEAAVEEETKAEEEAEEAKEGEETTTEATEETKEGEEEAKPEEKPKEEEAKE